MPKVKIPKRVGGVKIPKKVRKRANKAIGNVNNAAVRELASAAIGAAAGARRVRARVRFADDGPDLDGGVSVRIDADKFGEAFRAAAIDGFRRFLEGFEEGLREATIPEPPEAPPAPKPPAKPKKRKPSARSAAAAGAGE
jgi:hypothetical protein